MGRYDNQGRYVEHVYTDGSSRRNGRQDASAGYGVYYGNGDSRNTSQKLSGSHQTNQRAELAAVCHALHQASSDKPDVLVIHTDSKYAINSFGSWGDKWQKNGWRTSAGTPVKNADVIGRGIAVMNQLRSSKIEVQLKYVPGHSSSHGNNMADKLAFRAASKK